MMEMRVDFSRRPRASGRSKVSRSSLFNVLDDDCAACNGWNYSTARTPQTGTGALLRTSERSPAPPPGCRPAGSGHKDRPADEHRRAHEHRCLRIGPDRLGDPLATIELRPDGDEGLDLRSRTAAGRWFLAAGVRPHPRPKLWTLTPSRRTGRWPASVLSSSLSARAAMLSASAVGSRRALAARDRREVGIADLDRHGARGDRLLRRAIRRRRAPADRSRCGSLPSTTDRWRRSLPSPPTSTAGSAPPARSSRPCARSISHGARLPTIASSSAGGLARARR